MWKTGDQVGGEAWKKWVEYSHKVQTRHSQGRSVGRASGPRLWEDTEEFRNVDTVLDIC